MSNKKAFVYPINPNGSGPDERFSFNNDNLENNPNRDDAVHQVSPAWVLTFVRWAVRDTLRTKSTVDNNFLKTRDPVVVESDCVQLNVVIDKGTLTDSMSATLRVTDINYETAIAPGDFVFINMLNWENPPAPPTEPGQINWNRSAREVADKARSKLPINLPEDGFKGVFKVQGVRKMLVVDPTTGSKTFLVRVTGFAFTEFNNVIYFNPELIHSIETKNRLLFVANMSDNWKNLVGAKALTNVQDIIESLIDSFIGRGIGESGRRSKAGLKSSNTMFYIPQLVGSLLGVPAAEAAKDIYNFIFGIQQYSGSESQSLATGMNPSNLFSTDSPVWKPATKSQNCQGEIFNAIEYWNQQQVWSIFGQFTNKPLNELFSCFRVSPNGSIMPTIVLRQLPFTNEDFNAGNNLVTRFMDIPRWKLNPSLVLGMDIGRDESARINFFQYYGRTTIGKEGTAVSFETAGGNYLYDIDDVKRSGLKPIIVNTQFDDLTDNKPDIKSVQWAKIIGDCLIGGHLKLNGTIDCAGIVQPVSVGDNLEFDGVVYHIERVSHICSIDPESGNKSFRTSFGLSYGISLDSSSKGVVYPEMSFISAYDLRDNDANNNKILPGVSESQDVVYRPESLDEPTNHDKGVVGFTQPDRNASVHRTGEENQFNSKGTKK